MNSPFTSFQAYSHLCSGRLERKFSLFGLMPLSNFPEAKAKKPIIDICHMKPLFMPPKEIKPPPFRIPTDQLKSFSHFPFLSD